MTKSQSNLLWQNWFYGTLVAEYNANAKWNVARAGRILDDRIRSALVDLKGKLDYETLKFADGSWWAPDAQELVQLRRATGQVVQRELARRAA